MRLPKESKQNNKKMEGGWRTNSGTKTLMLQAEKHDLTKRTGMQQPKTWETDCDDIEATMASLMNGSFVSCAYILGNADSLKLIF